MRAPHGDPVAVRCGHERVRLDREVGHHRERYSARRRPGRRSPSSTSPHPTTCSRRTLVAASGSFGRRPGPDEWRVGIERGGDGEDRRQLLVLHADEASRLSGGVPGFGRDGRHRLAVVLRLVDRDDRPILELRPEPRRRLGKIGGGHDQPDAGHLHGVARVDRQDPGPGAGHGHEAGVELVGQVDVGDVALESRDAILAADAAWRLADPARAHRSAASAVARTASVIWP